MRVPKLIPVPHVGESKLGTKGGIKDPDPPNDADLDPQHCATENNDYYTGFIRDTERIRIDKGPQKIQSRKLKSRNGARNPFQEPSLELNSQAT
jgi:hypothetical protein